jgi:hypothetical protein
VLKGETLSSKDLRSGVVAKVPVSAWEIYPAFNRIFGLSARFTGGGSEALFTLPVDCPFFSKYGVGLAFAERPWIDEGLVSLSDGRARSSGPCFGEMLDTGLESDAMFSIRWRSTPRGGERGE